MERKYTMEELLAMPPELVDPGKDMPCPEGAIALPYNATTREYERRLRERKAHSVGKPESSMKNNEDRQKTAETLRYVARHYAAIPMAQRVRVAHVFLRDYGLSPLSRSSVRRILAKEAKSSTLPRIQESDLPAGKACAMGTRNHQPSGEK